MSSLFIKDYLTCLDRSNVRKKIWDRQTDGPTDSSQTHICFPLDAASVNTEIELIEKN